MTAPKHDGRRLGFRNQPHRTNEDVRDFGRWVFLQVIAAEVPDVLATLADVPGESDPDATALADWAQRWHLADDWCLAYAASSWRTWRRWPTLARAWWDRDDIDEGDIVNEHDEAAPRPLTSGTHIRWLVQHHVKGASFAQIAAASGCDAQTVHEACRRFAELVGLSPRPVKRGRPRRPVS